MCVCVFFYRDICVRARHEHKNKDMFVPAFCTELVYGLDFKVKDKDTKLGVYQVKS